MRKFLHSVSIEEACEKVEGLDIRNNTAARSVFFKTGIDYSRAELKKAGVELFALGSYDDLRSFCSHWLSNHSHTGNDNLLIALTRAIQSQAYHLISVRRAGPWSSTTGL